MDDAVLKMYGIKTNEDDTEFLKPGVCPRCHELTPVNARFCLKCGLPLSREATTTVESIKEDYMQFADFEELRKMKAAYEQGLEEISKFKEEMFKAKK